MTEAPPAPAPDALIVVHEQAEDEGLWFVAQTAPEAYLQAALRRLHRAVEGEDEDGGDWPDRTCQYCGESYYSGDGDACVGGAPTPAPAPAALIAAINAFLADAPKGKPHTGYRYGELLEQAADTLAAQARELEQTQRDIAVQQDLIAGGIHSERAALIRAEQAEARAESMAKDAERYRWLRDTWWMSNDVTSDGMAYAEDSRAIRRRHRRRAAGEAMTLCPATGKSCECQPGELSLCPHRALERMADNARELGLTYDPPAAPPREPYAAMVEAGAVTLRYRLGHLDNQKLAALVWQAMHDAWVPPPAPAPDALIANLNAASHDERLSSGALYRKAAAALAAQARELEQVDTEMKRAHAGWEDAIVRAEQAEARAEAMRNWLDNNTTFTQSAGNENNIALASVSKRIWFHVTDDESSYPFTAVIDAALAKP